MTCQLPEGARYVRDEDGDVIILDRDGGNVGYLESWLRNHCAPGTDADVITDSMSGAIITVVLQPPTSYSVPDHRTAARRFRLLRHEDVSGVSGTGVVAHGVEWPDGTVSLRWSVPGLPPSFANWECLEAILTVHGHQGKTEVEWID